MIVVPTFVTKVTEYFCSGGFFSPDKIRFLTRHFLTKVFHIIKKVIFFELKYEKIFHLGSFFVKLRRGLKMVILANLGTINGSIYFALLTRA